MDPLPRRVEIGAGHPAFVGHFPGRPVLPGVALLAEVLEAVALDPNLTAAVGAAPQFGVVKFSAPVLPGATLEISFQPGERSVGFSVASDNGQVAASGQIVRVDRGAGAAS